MKELIDKGINSNNYQPVPLLKMPFHGTPSEIKIMREMIMEGKNQAEDGDIFEVNCGRHIFRYEWIFPLSTIFFEGRELSVQNNSDNVLESQFGDFMMYPPDMYNGHGSISDNIRHNWRNYEKLDAFLSMDSNAVYEFMIGAKE